MLRPPSPQPLHPAALSLLPPTQASWEDCWWEASDWFGLRELGAKKSGKTEYGAQDFGTQLGSMYVLGLFSCKCSLRQCPATLEGLQRFADDARVPRIIPHAIGSAEVL